MAQVSDGQGFTLFLYTVANEQEIGRVLVVDDNPLIVKTISELLRSQHVHVITSKDGREALTALQGQTVDVIISDVMMPSMDGYQLHEAVREKPDLCHIPFVFLTALDSQNEIARGQQSGADDYLTKPFDPLALLNVVKGKISRSRALKNLIDVREDTYRKKVMQTLSHEFRTPLVAINTGTELLRDHVEALSTSKVRNLVDAIHRGGQRLERLVQDFMVLQQIEAGIAQRTAASRRKPEKAAELLRQFLTCYRDELQIAPDALDVQIRDEDAAIDVFSAHVLDALFRLTQNAAKFSQPGSQICLRGKVVDDCYTFSVGDRGVGLAPEKVSEALRPFSQIDRDRMEQQGSGMGLHIASCFVSINGGQISHRPRDGGGSWFIISIPLLNAPQ